MIDFAMPGNCSGHVDLICQSKSLESFDYVTTLYKQSMSRVMVLEMLHFMHKQDNMVSYHKGIMLNEFLARKMTFSLSFIRHLENKEWTSVFHPQNEI